MSKDTDTKVSGGFSLGTLLFVLFLTLKLTGTIGWSWWWVAAPLWGPWVLVLGGLALYGVFVTLAAALD